MNNGKQKTTSCKQDPGVRDSKGACRCLPVESMTMRVPGERKRYQRYTARTTARDVSAAGSGAGRCANGGTAQKGCWNDASAAKYRSSVAACAS